MSNEIPDAKRLIPSSQPTVAPQPAKGFPFFAKVAVIAVPIVVGGLLLAWTVREKAEVSPEAALNDTRSPLAEEFSQPDVTTTTPDTPTLQAPPAETGTDTPFDVSETYPEVDPNQEPLAVAVNPAIAGLSDSESTATSLPSAVLPSPKASYGHLPYRENKAQLSSAGSFVRENYERAELLDLEAAQAFERMRQSARADGINLMPVSGFRTIADQQALFDAQINRKGSAEVAAKFSAPPGHSEHHTGYAIDITDADRPETDIKHSFEETAAYQWLISNARAYGFEESFPKNNLQGVTFEPWHWRYVGSERARQTFSDAQQLYPSP